MTGLEVRRVDEARLLGGEEGVATGAGTGRSSTSAAGLFVVLLLLARAGGGLKRLDRASHEKGVRGRGGVDDDGRQAASFQRDAGAGPLQQAEAMVRGPTVIVIAEESCQASGRVGSRGLARRRALLDALLRATAAGRASSSPIPARLANLSQHLLSPPIHRSPRPAAMPASRVNDDVLRLVLAHVAAPLFDRSDELEQPDRPQTVEAFQHLFKIVLSTESQLFGCLRVSRQLYVRPWALWGLPPHVPLGPQLTTSSALRSFPGHRHRASLPRTSVVDSQVVLTDLDIQERLEVRLVGWLAAVQQRPDLAALVRSIALSHSSWLDLKI